MMLYYLNQLHALVAKNNKETIPQLIEKFKDKKEFTCYDLNSLTLKVSIEQGEIYGCLYLATKYKKEYDPYTRFVNLGKIEFNSVPHNCSALMISGCSSVVRKQGLATLLTSIILEYAKKAGYSFIFASTAAEQTTTYYLPTLKKKFNFRRMGMKYRNPRSGNVITWSFLNLNLGLEGMF